VYDVSSPQYLIVKLLAVAVANQFHSLNIAPSPRRCSLLDLTLAGSSSPIPPNLITLARSYLISTSTAPSIQGRRSSLPSRPSRALSCLQQTQAVSGTFPYARIARVPSPAQYNSVALSSQTFVSSFDFVRGQPSAAHPHSVPSSCRCVVALTFVIGSGHALRVEWDGGSGSRLPPDLLTLAGRQAGALWVAAWSLALCKSRLPGFRRLSCLPGTDLSGPRLPQFP
jgi:hypothetical protein